MKKGYERGKEGVSVVSQMIAEGGWRKGGQFQGQQNKAVVLCTILANIRKLSYRETENKRKV
jgi:hypothetical protein